MAKRKNIIRPTRNGVRIFPSEFLTAEDLQGRDVTVTIDKIVEKEVMLEGGKAIKQLIYFKGKKKALIACATQGHEIGSMYGAAVENWAGKKITIYPTTCLSFGVPDTPCIRVRVQIGQQDEVNNNNSV